MEIDGETPSGGERAQEITDKPKPIVVLLVGLPGSGKSTFCYEVIRSSSRPWARICQDSINNGKAGTKIQCLSSAAAALKDGKSIFLDRCNIEREQRADFLKLGGEEVEKHVVMLDLPAKLCISRSVKRIGHEGKLEGGKAAAVVNRILQKKEYPKLSEGFTRITICQSENDVDQTMKIYSSFGPLDTLPSGYFGKKNQDTKTQVGIMRFLKKVDPSGDVGSKPTVFQKLIPDELSVEKDPDPQGTENAPALIVEDRNNVKEHDKLNSTAPYTSASENVHVLAFPSISTSDFRFDLEKASEIIVEKVEEFVSRIGDATLVLVDLSHGSKILSLVKSKAAIKNIDSKRFFTLVGDITQLRSERGLNCNVIANAANWRLKPGGGGVNASIFRAAGSDLEIATKARAAHLSSGNSLVVPLPTTSPLFTKEGVTHVIHVLGPNMNPMRPDCLKDDYVQGCKILRDAYSSLFEGFLSILRSQRVVSRQMNERSTQSGDLRELVHISDHQKCKREDTYESDKNKKYKGSPQDLKIGTSNCLEGENSPGRSISGSKTSSWAPWAQSLYNIAMHPEKHMNEVVEICDDVVVVYDAYPKSQCHLLVLSRVDGIDSITDIHEDHISLLNTMHAAGLKWAEHFLNVNQSLSFRLGYHAEPSMRQLHLHVISQDFDSERMKKKQHWNTFNTPFFLDSMDVIKDVKDHGKVRLKNSDKLLSTELRCHRCRSAHPNLPRLKAHISSCRAPFPAALLQSGRLIFSRSSNFVPQ